MPYYLIENKTGRILASGLPRIENIPTQGFRVIAIEDNVPINEETMSPLTLDQLVQQNYEGLLAFNPQYSFVTFDDLASQTLWDITPPNTKGAIGDGNVWLSGVNGFLQTITIIAGTAFDRGKIFWTVHQNGTEEVDGFRRNIQYSPLMPDTIQVSVSNDGGASFTVAPYGVEFILGGLGNQIVVRFENATPGRTYIGHFGLLY